MDFPLAEPVKAALHAAVEHDDLGYLGARHDGLLEAFAGFAERRLGWTVDPAQVVPVTDVMVGVEELLLVLTEPGDGVVINPPVYPPYFADIPHARRRVVEVPLLADGALDVAGHRRGVRRRRPRAAAVQPAQPDGPRGPRGPSWRRSPKRRRGARRVGHRRRDPRPARVPGAPASSRT